MEMEIHYSGIESRKAELVKIVRLDKKLIMEMTGCSVRVRDMDKEKWMSVH